MANTKTNKGLGLLGTIVFTIFLVLKLAQIGLVKDWSWWWVFSPFWIPILLCIAIYIFILLIGVSNIFFKRKFERKKKDNEIKITTVPKKTSKFQQRLEQMEKEKNERK